MTKSEARDKCKVDPIFLGEVLGYDFQEDCHSEMFSAMAADKSKTLLLLPRGHFKTSATCVEIVRRILVNPDIRVILMSANVPNTKKWLKEIKSHFSGANSKSKLPTLFPEFCAKGKMGTDSSFTCPARTRKHLKEPSVWVASQRSVQTGQHANLIFGDDLVHSSNWRNVDLQDKLEQDFWGLFPLLDPGGQVIVTGTRYSWSDLYQRIILKASVNNEWSIVIRSCYKPDGSLLFPERVTKDGRKIGFTKELLDSIKRDDYSVFTSQYLNEIVATGDQLFPQSLLQRATKSMHDPAYPKGAPCIFTVDLANTATATADSSVVCVGSNDSYGRVWVQEVMGGQLSPHAVAVLIMDLFVKYRPARILLEKQSGAEYFKEFLNTLARDKGLALPLDFTKSRRQKDAKHLAVASLEGAFKQNRLFLLASITDYAKLSEELEHFPKGRYDDRADCLAMLFASLGQNIPMMPPIRKLPWIFDTPYTDAPAERSTSMLGDGFTC